MYFLPEEEIEGCTLSSKLENNFKSMRVFDLSNQPFQHDHFIKYGSEILLHSIDRNKFEISGCKFSHNGIVYSYNSANIPQLTTIGCIANTLPLEALPLLVVIRVMKGLKKYKICFVDISGNISGRIKVKDIVCDNGFESFRATAKTKSNYIALFFYCFDKYSGGWWKKRWQKSSKTFGQRSFYCLFVLFEIQLKGDYLHECVELSRINLEEYIEGQFNVDDMVVDENEEKILFGVTKLYNSPSLILLLYDIKTRTIEKSIVAFENPGYSRVYFVDHSNFKGGVIIPVSFIRNEIKIFTRNDEMDYTILRSIPFNFDDALLPCSCFPYCISNRNNQVLFFLNHRTHVAVYDLFDISNGAILPFSSKEKPRNICFNKTGEEIFIYTHKKKIHVYLYKSFFKSLTLQCVFVVRKTYTKSKLMEMRLPKQLYKYF